MGQYIVSHCTSLFLYYLLLLFLYWNSLWFYLFALLYIHKILIIGVHLTFSLYSTLLQFICLYLFIPRTILFSNWCSTLSITWLVVPAFIHLFLLWLQLVYAGRYAICVIFTVYNSYAIECVIRIIIVMHDEIFTLLHSAFMTTCAFIICIDLYLSLFEYVHKFSLETTNL